MYNWVPRAESATSSFATVVDSSGVMNSQPTWSEEMKATSQGSPEYRGGLHRLKGDSLKAKTPSGWNYSNLGIDQSDPDVQAIGFGKIKPSNYQNFSSVGKGVKAPFRPSAENPAMMNKLKGTITPGAQQAKQALQMLSKVGTAGKIAGAIIAPLAIAGMSAYAMYGSMRGQVEQHDQVNKAFKRTRGALRNGGMTRRQDFESNPIMSFSRPRVRGNNLGATGNLTLSLNNQRTSR
jgi:hypothetical protein